MRTGIRQAFLASFLILLVSFGYNPPQGKRSSLLRASS